MLRAAVALLEHRAAAAAVPLERAVSRRPRDKIAAGLLGEALYRQDRFEAAAPWLARAGQPARARKLASFAGTTPYRYTGEPGPVPFLQTDPLPVVEAGIDDGRTGLFLIDTGAGEVYLDRTFARELQVPSFGVERGGFGGGLVGRYEHGRVRALQLGGMSVRDLPVVLLDTRPLMALPDGQRIDGILGTVLFYHFLVTIDYPGGRLVFRPATAEGRRQFESSVEGRSRIEVPFWMSDDHYMVAWGRLNESEPRLFFVDTGLGGAAFTAPPSMLAEAGIHTFGPKERGRVAPGEIAVQTFPIERLSLGAAQQRDLLGMAGPFPGPLEREHRFRIAGLISHGFFRPYQLTFDFARMRLILT